MIDVSHNVAVRINARYSLVKPALKHTSWFLCTQTLVFESLFPKENSPSLAIETDYNLTLRYSRVISLNSPVKFSHRPFTKNRFESVPVLQNMN